MSKELTAQFSESIDTFKVNFGGDKHTIDAELFTTTINNTIDLVKASANAINPQAFLELEIKANKEGSFITELDAIAKYGLDLITKDNVSLLLKKPDLLEDSAWKFAIIKNISAKIEDKEFLEKVHTRKIKTLYAGV